MKEEEYENNNVLGSTPAGNDIQQSATHEDNVPASGLLEADPDDIIT